MQQSNRLSEILVTGTVFGDPAGRLSALPDRCRKGDPRGEPPASRGDSPHHACPGTDAGPTGHDR
ncbi:MAG: hypothetical protein ACE5GE_15415 [Phycisphaerae bacterium]